MNPKSKSNFDWYLILIIVLAVIYSAYWVCLANYRYTTFKSTYFDIGGSTYNMYLHLHDVQMSAAQYLVFFSHISLFSILLLPFFALYQQPITLIIIQDTFLALTAILVYFVVKDIISNNKLAFLFAFAFLINPGLRGLFYFDFHPEAFIPFFYILAFYFYFKNKKAYFVLSLLFLLSIIDTSYLVAPSLLLGLFIYEFAYNKNKNYKEYRDKLNLLLVGFALTILAALFYHFAPIYILNSYKNTSYSAVPPISRLIDFSSAQLKSILNPNSYYDPRHSLFVVATYGLLGLLAIFFGFGITSIMDPILSIVLYSPWILEVFYLQNSSFASFDSQYYGYIVGAGLVSAILGYIILARKSNVSKLDKINAKTVRFVSLSILAFSLIFSVIGLLSGFYLNYSSLSLLTFPKSNVNATQINSVLSMIPGNASVLTQISIAPHLFYIRNLELPPIYTPENSGVVSNLTVLWVAPDYIVIDKNLFDYGTFVNYSFDVYDYMGNNYTTYYNNSGIYIYKRIKS